MCFVNSFHPSGLKFAARTIQAAEVTLTEIQRLHRSFLCKDTTASRFALAGASC